MTCVLNRDHILHKVKYAVCFCVFRSVCLLQQGSSWGDPDTAGPSWLRVELESCGQSYRLVRTCAYVSVTVSIVYMRELKKTDRPHMSEILMILTFRPLEADTPPFYKHSHFDLSCASSPHLALPVLLFISMWLQLETFEKKKVASARFCPWFRCRFEVISLNIWGKSRAEVIKSYLWTIKDAKFSSFTHSLFFFCWAMTAI